MKRSVLKIAALLALVAMLVLTLASCGNTAAAANASGTWEGISWEYVKDGQTLTLRGSGDMANSATADTVGWAAVRNSVKKVIMDDAITSVGNYAFYSMPLLESVQLSAALTSVGDYAFALCSALTSVSLPEGVTSVGSSAFECCYSLKSVQLPAGVTSLGERAFAFCRSLESATLVAPIATVGHWTFKDCAKLTSLTVLNGYGALSDTALEGAGVTEAKTIASAAPTTVLTVYYKDASGNEVSPAVTKTYSMGDIYNLVAPTVDGYTAKQQNISGTIDGTLETMEIVFEYEEKIVATEPPAEETGTQTDAPAVNEDKGVTLGAVIALCIFGIALIGIIVAAVLLMRADKKQKQNGNTVRKNGNDPKKRNK